jgi:hypothetical protein
MIHDFLIGLRLVVEDRCRRIEPCLEEKTGGIGDRGSKILGVQVLRISNS